MRQDPNTRSAARHIQFTGTVIPLTFAVGALATGALGIAVVHYTMLALSSWLILIALLFFEARLQIQQRAGLSNPATAQRVLQYFGSSVVVWLVATASFGLGIREPANTPTTEHGVLAIFGTATILALTLGSLRYLQRISLAELAERDALVRWTRATVAVALVVLLWSILMAGGALSAQQSMVRTLVFLTLLPVLEWLVRTLAAEGQQVSLIHDTRSVELLFSRSDPLSSLFGFLEHRFEVDLRSTWALAVVRKTALPLLCGLVLLGWLSTSLVIVPATQVALLERLGRPLSREPMSSGIHFKAPWPVDRIQRIESSRVHTMPLGFAGPRSGASLLWTKQHAAEEYQLLLGDGRDLVTINAVLHYRVDDPWTWHYGTQNPEAMLRVAAEQALLVNTVDRSLDDVLSENTATLVANIEESLRAGVKAQSMGARVIGLTLHGLHPPVDVAEDYQAVVSAQHKREIAILSARYYAIETTRAAHASALLAINGSEAASVAREGLARGEADAFNALQTVHASSPASLEQRLRNRALERILEGRALLVIDDRIERDGGVLWFND